MREESITSLLPDDAGKSNQLELRECLRSRRIDPKFLYVTPRQAEKWLALHEAYSPERIDPGCAAIYDRAFAAAAAKVDAKRARVVGLGCGGGQKDARLLAALAGQGKEVSYTPCDISPELVRAASRAAQCAVPDVICQPVLLDLSRPDNWRQIMHRKSAAAEICLITFFGMIPNFEPEVILPQLARLVGAGDWLLLSANLAPGPDYAAGVRQVLSGYDNALTKDWLFAFLESVGARAGDGLIQFAIQESEAGFLRIAAEFCFSKPRTVMANGENFEFNEGDTLRLFFSYRYTPPLVASLLTKYKLSILDQWIAPSGEEGVFLCRRAGEGGQ